MGGAAVFVLPGDNMGGAERVTRLLAEAALKSGRFSAVELLVLTGPDRGTLADLAANPMARVTYLRSRGLLKGLFRLWESCSGKHFRLVFSSNTAINATLSLMRRTGRLKTDRLVTRESTMVFERDFGLKTGPARLLYRAYGAQDVIICQTDRMAESLNHHTSGRFRGRIAIIDNPVAERVKEHPGSSETKVPGRVIWCGRMIEVKQPLRAVAALGLLRRMGCDAHLIMMGDGPLTAEVDASIDHHGLRPWITLTGRVTDVTQWMATATVGLVTSDVEGFPNVVTEMLQAGVRGVVSTDCAGGLDRVPGVLVAESPSATDLAQGLCALLTQTEQSAGIAAFLEARRPELVLERMLGS